MCWVLCQALHRPPPPSSSQPARQMGNGEPAPSTDADMGSERVGHLPGRTRVCLMPRPGTFHYSTAPQSSRLPRIPGIPSQPCWQLGLAHGKEGPYSIALWPTCPFPRQIRCPWNSPFGTTRSNRAFTCLLLMPSKLPNYLDGPSSTAMLLASTIGKRSLKI